MIPFEINQTLLQLAQEFGKASENETYTEYQYSLLLKYVYKILKLDYLLEVPVPQNVIPIDIDLEIYQALRKNNKHNSLTAWQELLIGVHNYVTGPEKKKQIIMTLHYLMSIIPLYMPGNKNVLNEDLTRRDFFSGEIEAKIEDFAASLFDKKNRAVWLASSSKKMDKKSEGGLTEEAYTKFSKRMSDTGWSRLEIHYNQCLTYPTIAMARAPLEELQQVRFPKQTHTFSNNKLIPCPNIMIWFVYNKEGDYVVTCEKIASLGNADSDQKIILGSLPCNWVVTIYKIEATGIMPKLLLFQDESLLNLCLLRDSSQWLKNNLAYIEGIEKNNHAQAGEELEKLIAKPMEYFTDKSFVGLEQELPHLPKIVSAEGASFLYWLTSIGLDGFSFLTRLFATYARYVKEIASFWMFELVTNKDHLVRLNTSSFFWCSTSPYGISFLFTLKRENDNFFNDLSSEILYTIPPFSAEYRGMSAFHFLIEDEIGIQFLLSLLASRNDLIDALPENFLFEPYFNYKINTLMPPPMHTLAKNHKGIDLLLSIFCSRFQLFEKLTSNLLYGLNLEQNDPYSKKESDESAFYYLVNASSDKGMELLFKAFEYNKNLLDGGLINALLKVKQKKNNPCFFTLSKKIKGAEFLWHIFTARSHILIVLDKDDLLTTYNDRNNPHDKASPFYWLCTTIYGIKIIREILEINPNIFSKVSYSKMSNVLTTLRSEGALDNPGSSAFHALTSQEEGQKLLTHPSLPPFGLNQNLAAKQPNFYPNCSALFYIFYFKTGEQIRENNDFYWTWVDASTIATLASGPGTPYHNLSLFFILCARYPKKLFHMLLEKPDMISVITPEVLYTASSSLNRKFGANSSAFFHLTTNIYGLRIIQKLFAEKPSLIKDLKRYLPHLNNIIEYFRLKNWSIAFGLTYYTEGQELVLNYPQLYPLLRYDFLKLLTPLPKKTKLKTNGICNLFLSNEGRKIFENLVNTNNFCATISFIDLITPIDIGLMHLKIAPLHLLFSEDPTLACNFLEIFFSKNPASKNELTIEHFTTHSPLKLSSTNRKRSLLSFLAETSKGITLLYSLFFSRVDLIAQLKTEDLWVTPKGCCLAFVVFLLSWHRDGKGKEFLLFLIEKNPKLIENISADILEQNFEDSEAKIILNTIDLLMKDKTGREILKRIFFHNKDLTNQLSPEVVNKEHGRRHVFFSYTLKKFLGEIQPSIQEKGEASTPFPVQRSSP